MGDQVRVEWHKFGVWVVLDGDRAVHTTQERDDADRVARDYRAIRGRDAAGVTCPECVGTGRREMRYVDGVGDVRYRENICRCAAGRAQVSS